MPTQTSSAHFFLSWAKERIDEMDATLASLESKAGQMQAETRVKADQFIAGMSKKRDEFEAMPSRTVVLIDVRTGQYTTGKTWLEARAEFDTRFGTEIAGYVYRVRDRTFVGGGIG